MWEGAPEDEAEVRRPAGGMKEAHISFRKRGVLGSMKNAAFFVWGEHTGRARGSANSGVSYGVNGVFAGVFRAWRRVIQTADHHPAFATTPPINILNIS
jgi:hypothetical protein